MRPKNALIIANIGVLPLMTAFGGLNGDLLQYYASGYFNLTETEIGVAIGLLSFTIPLQFLSTQFVRQWGARWVLLAGYSIRFCLVPLLLVIPALLAQNRIFGLTLFYALVFTVHLVHVTTFGVAWQPIIRSVTKSSERGGYFGRMRFLFNGFNLVFFTVLGLVVGEAISPTVFLSIVLLLMAYCMFAFWIVWRQEGLDAGVVAQPRFREIFSQTKLLWHNLTYRALITISVLRLPSSLPLFITYLALIVGLSAKEISLIIICRAAGMMAGFIVWGKVIRRFGYTKAIVGPLVLLTGISGLWLLFSIFNHNPLIIMFLGIIAMVTAFSHAGLGLGMVTAVHNTAQDENAVVVLTSFDILDMGLESVMAALMGFYIHATFITLNDESTQYFFDPYIYFCLGGAILSGLAIIIANRTLNQSKYPDLKKT